MYAETKLLTCAPPVSAQTTAILCTKTCFVPGVSRCQTGTRGSVSPPRLWNQSEACEHSPAALILTFSSWLPRPNDWYHHLTHFEITRKRLPSSQAVPASSPTVKRSDTSSANSRSKFLISPPQNYSLQTLLSSPSPLTFWRAIVCHHSLHKCHRFESVIFKNCGSAIVRCMLITT